MNNKDPNKELLEWYEQDTDTRSAGLAFAGTGDKENRDAGIQNSPGDGDAAPLASFAVSKEKGGEEGEEAGDSKSSVESMLRLEKIDPIKGIESKTEIEKAIKYTKFLNEYLEKNMENLPKMGSEEKEKTKSNIRELAEKIVQVIDGIN